MTPRYIRQHQERQAWVDDLVYYLTGQAYIYYDIEKAEQAACRLCYLNLDEGGEIMEEDAVKWFKEYIREVLEE